MQNKI